MADTPSLERFNRRFEPLDETHRELREDIGALGNSILQLSPRISKFDRRRSDVDRRLTDVKDELEGTTRIELGGAFANPETRLEHLIERRLDKQPTQGFNED